MQIASNILVSCRLQLTLDDSAGQEAASSSYLPTTHTFIEAVSQPETRVKR